MWKYKCKNEIFSHSSILLPWKPEKLQECCSCMVGGGSREPRVSDAKMLIAFVLLAAASLGALHVSM